jgi:hypothetical protein
MMLKQCILMKFQVADGLLMTCMKPLGCQKKCTDCRLKLYPRWIKLPESEEEIADSMAEFVEAGFDGCIGSADVTHIVLEKCHSRLKNQHLGGKSSLTTRAYQIVVNHRRQILASTVGYPGRWNHKTIVRFDGFVTDVQRGNYLDDNEFELLDKEGEKVSYEGGSVDFSRRWQLELVFSYLSI